MLPGFGSGRQVDALRSDENPIFRLLRQVPNHYRRSEWGKGIAGIFHDPNLSVTGFFAHRGDVSLQPGKLACARLLNIDRIIRRVEALQGIPR